MPAEAGERTEAPTPRRRREARQKGQIARSQDLTAVVILLASLLALRLLCPHMGAVLLNVFHRALTDPAVTDPNQASPLAVAVFTQAAAVVAPILGVVLVAGLAAVWAQVGWIFTVQPLTPNLGKLNPISGITRLFSGRSVASMLINVGKLALVGSVAYATLIGSADRVLYASQLEFESVVVVTLELMFTLALRLVLVLLLLAIIDYVYQRYRHEKDLKMTKEEVKDELRSMEGDPVVKQRRRRVQQQLALQRLRRDVPKADVIVTNPTHVAVAIQYDAQTMPAPRVVAKGGDYLALRIRQIALQLGIPIVERPPLARMVYSEVEVGQYIPEKFYQAIAEILAYVYRLTGKSMAGAVS
ncbi:MAG: flagellar biosynthesis protein FlhB [Phycisphaerales bacterium]|nr:MAG: flagellar biosynthesis protein FlhB [Phycisphaerales bacterium]